MSDNATKLSSGLERPAGAAGWGNTSSAALSARDRPRGGWSSRRSGGANVLVPFASFVVMRPALAWRSRRWPVGPT